MTDRELLESAARAAGWEGAEFQDMRGWGEVRHGFSEALWVPELECYVNPLEDDGDALRLAVDLKIDLHFERNGIADQEYIVEAFCLRDDETRSCMCLMEVLGDDPRAATRRAITRAAAAIGEKVK